MEIEQATTRAQCEEIFLLIHGLQEEISDAEQKRDDSIAFLETRIEAAKALCDKQTQYKRQEIERLSHILQEFYRANPPKDGKTIAFACGKVSASKVPTKFFFGGEEANASNKALLAFVKENAGEYVNAKTVEFVSWGELKKKLKVDGEQVFFADSGEILQGLSAQQFPDKFTVTAY